MERRCDGATVRSIAGRYPQRREKETLNKGFLSPSQRGFISIGYIWTEDASPVAGGRYAGWVITFVYFFGNGEPIDL